MRKGKLCNEQSPRGEHEIGAEDGDVGRVEGVSPVGRTWLDDCEEKACDGGRECSAGYCTKGEESEQGIYAVGSKDNIPTRKTRGTWAAMKPTNKLHRKPDTNMGRRRTTVCIAVYPI